jgi:hypothetical protein
LVSFVHSVTGKCSYLQSAWHTHSAKEGKKKRRKARRRKIREKKVKRRTSYNRSNVPSPKPKPQKAPKYGTF